LKKPYRAPFNWASSSASDDPHFNMWDGQIHDTMVWGWFTWVKNEVLNVQIYTSYCGYWGGAEDTPRPPTCIKRGVVEVKVPGTPMRMVSSTDGIIREWGTTRKIGNTWLEGRYHAQPGNVWSTSMTVGDAEAALYARVSRGSVAFSLPRAGTQYGATNG